MLRDLRMDNVILQRMHSAMNIFRFQYIPMWYLMPLEGKSFNSSLWFGFVRFFTYGTGSRPRSLCVET